MPEEKLSIYSKALFISERRVHWSSALFLFSGLKRIKGWKRLTGFRESPANFTKRLQLANLNYMTFAAILGSKKAYPKRDSELTWLRDIDTGCKTLDLSKLRGNFPALDEFLDRGVITPFALHIHDAALKVREIAKTFEHDTNIFLKGLLQQIEQLTLKSFVLHLNIFSISPRKEEENASEQFRIFLEQFNSPEVRQNFFREYPVLTRNVLTRLQFWVDSTKELIERLARDRPSLWAEFGITPSDPLDSVKVAGDTHNKGRSVTVLFFASGKAIVYKPRSTSIEEGFQKYLNFFNSVTPDLTLRKISVINKDTYGWVEFVKYSKPDVGAASHHYHYKLGFLTAIVFSINGVDVFFENLISAGTDPVIIDLETMFHTPIDTEIDAGPMASTYIHLHNSVTGIGVLPRPGRGATETEVFDVSVLGAAVNARAPYTVSSIENFGRADMKITETPGWIHESTSSSVDGPLDPAIAQSVFDGLKAGFECILTNRLTLSEPNGVIDQCFSNSERRLIVRDTKVYGSLQGDECHPDLLRDQVDREWHLDNLWRDTINRPNLLCFISSEIAQLRQGDIPYFTGALNSPSVTGADGTIVDLADVLKDSPLERVRKKLTNFSETEKREQLRLAATALGLSELDGVTQPSFSSNVVTSSNALKVASFISQRAQVLGDYSWIDTSLNPVPAAKGIDPVNIVPSDPFLYEGVMGIAMFFYDVWLMSSDDAALQTSKKFTEAVLRELNSNHNFSASGFVGLASVVYVINRAIERGVHSFDRYSPALRALLVEISKKIHDEEKLDFLLGIAGIGSAILPYVTRTSDKRGVEILREIYSRLEKSADLVLINRTKIPGLDYLRGFSHGISGIALAIYRIGRFLGNSRCDRLTAELLILEYELVLNGGWTDSHSYAGQPLVGWCHGSAGIALGLSQMPHPVSACNDVESYYSYAIDNTLKKFKFDSQCLCHGTLGNLLCLRATNLREAEVKEQMLTCERSLLSGGFKSLGAAQSMSAGLMTGIVGAGYYLLGQENVDTNYGFLTLS